MHDERPPAGWPRARAVAARRCVRTHGHAPPPSRRRPRACRAPAAAARTPPSRRRRRGRASPPISRDDRAQADRRMDGHRERRRPRRTPPSRRCRACAPRISAADRPPRTATIIVARCTTTQSASTTALARCASHSSACARAAALTASRSFDLAAQRRAAPSRASSPAIDAVGESCFGQRSVQLWCVWQAWQPASPATAASRSAARAVARIVDERPGAVERRRAEVVGIPADDVARRVADAAADAFDRRRRLRGARGDAGAIARERRRARVAVGTNAPLARAHLSKNARHVGDEVAHHRQVARAARFPARRRARRLHVGAAGPARLAVDRHRAGAAHADAAGEAIGERRIDPALDVRDDVEHGLRWQRGTS